MDMMDMLRASGGLDAIANQLGIPPAMAEAGAGALLPAVVGGFQKQSDAAGGGEGGLGSLIGMLGELGGAGLADNVLGPQDTDVNKGNDILGQIFGSKDVSRTVAGHASGQTGIDPAILKKMLPILAMLVGGYLSSRGGGQQTQGGAGGILGSILGSVLGGGQQAAPASGGGMLGGLGSLIDLNGDGNPLDDIIGMAGKLAR
ncbi:MAG TPA: DUF937 domain-containing protein [Novosphingobium sp.]|nr:DUF937 domain-containing protein [Novosphingobium sp.]HQA18191.1 DUF937 domain-containing protein [Novosphingobium sp.]